MKSFNTTGICFPEYHYMVDMSEQLSAAVNMIDNGTYFCINRGRQYGKTTFLTLLKEKIQHRYTVFSISLEAFSKGSFQSFERLLIDILYQVAESLKYGEITGISDYNKTLLQSINKDIENDTIRIKAIFSELLSHSEYPVVLIIDEVDQAGNYESFIKFLGYLRDSYLKRRNRPAFKSVILSSVYDVKNLKIKVAGEEALYNSPWNIARSFDVPMEFSSADITKMLTEYSDEHKTVFDTVAMGELIYRYTGGYPFLVCRLCQIIDEDALHWNRDGFLSALRILLKESNTLFEDMDKKIQEYPKMKTMFKGILYNGQMHSFNLSVREINIAYMFRFVRDDNSKVAIANPIFETKLYNLFLSEEALAGNLQEIISMNTNQFIEAGKLNMNIVLEKFIQYYNDIYGNVDEKFKENEGRRLFMMFMKPIINGTGNYYIEAETRDGTRTDMIVDYRGEQFLIEMKIWRGAVYNEKGKEQLLSYMERLHLRTGYLLSFNFNKNKASGINTTKYDDKTIVEAIV